MLSVLLLAALHVKKLSHDSILMVYICLCLYLVFLGRIYLWTLRESWIRGCSDSRTIPSVGLQDYEDTRLKTSSRVRMGLSLAWKASLAMRIFKISYHCNRLCVTLTLSGVYINRRVLVRRTSTPPYNNHTIG